MTAGEEGSLLTGLVGRLLVPVSEAVGTTELLIVEMAVLSVAVAELLAMVELTATELELSAAVSVSGAELDGPLPGSWGVSMPQRLAAAPTELP